MTLDARYLREVQARLNAAALGPWVSMEEGRDHESGDSFIQTPELDLYLIGGSPADRAFVAHARRDIELLLHEVIRLTADE